MYSVSLDFPFIFFGEISGFDLFPPRISGYDAYKSEPIEYYILCLTTEQNVRVRHLDKEVFFQN